MSSLIRIAVALSILAIARDARAEEAVPPPREPRAAPRPWDASLRAGWGAAFTNGINYVGPSVGLAIGRRFGWLRLELAGRASTGGDAQAENAAIRYRSEYASTQATFGAGLDIALGAIRLRPAACVGVSVVDGHTRVGTAVARDTHADPIVGLCPAIVAVIGRIEAGAVGEAYFLPTWPAAPTAGAYLTAGVVF